MFILTSRCRYHPKTKAANRVKKPATKYQVLEVRLTKPDILLFEGMAEQLTERLSHDFHLHRIADSQAGLALPAGLLSSIKAIVISGADEIDTELIAALPNLEIISFYSVGYDGIDVAAVLERDIVVTHTPEVLDDEVANTAIILLLAVKRQIVRLDRYVRDGLWEKTGAPPLSNGIAGNRVGIVGMGRIGQAIAEKLSVFHCQISYHARSRKQELPYEFFADLLEMATDCDVLILIVPGGDSTHHLIGREEMEALGPGGILINVARGSVIDETAMIEALKTGKLGGAGLDVFENEPHVPDELRAMDNVVLLPHVGSATVETRGAMGDLAVENLISWFRDGKAISPIPECRNNVSREDHDSRRSG